jgi:hypothetical protein
VAAMPFQRKQERHRCHAGKMMIMIVVMTVVIMVVMLVAMTPAAAFAAVFPRVAAFVQWEILAHPDIEFAHVSPCFDVAELTTRRISS